MVDDAGLENSGELLGSEISVGTSAQETKVQLRNSVMSEFRQRTKGHEINAWLCILSSLCTIVALPQQHIECLFVKNAGER